jgi:hypothetical protein
MADSMNDAKALITLPPAIKDDGPEWGEIKKNSTNDADFKE